MRPMPASSGRTAVAPVLERGAGALLEKFAPLRPARARSGSNESASSSPRGPGRAEDCLAHLPRPVGDHRGRTPHLVSRANSRTDQDGSAYCKAPPSRARSAGRSWWASWSPLSSGSVSGQLVLVAPGVGEIPGLHVGRLARPALPRTGRLPDPALARVKDAGELVPTRIKDANPPGTAPEGMAWIPPGRFAMGSDYGPFGDARPIHTVELDGFWMDRTPVTNDQFAAVSSRRLGVTLAEREPDPKDFPGVPRRSCWSPARSSSTLRPARSRSTTPRAGGRYAPGSSWKHPEGPGS